MHNTIITLTSLLLVQWVHAKEFLIKKSLTGRTLWKLLIFEHITTDENLMKASIFILPLT